MIRSFKGRDTRRFFEGHRVAAFQGFANQAARRPTLDGAEALGDLAVLAGSRLEALRGDRAGRHGIRNAQGRICIRWTAQGPCDVEDRGLSSRRDDDECEERDEAGASG